MKRDLTVLILCGLLLIADAAIFQETLAASAAAKPALVAIAAEIAAAVMLVWLALAAYRQKFRRQKRPASRWRFAVAGPLRRLFVSVWS